MILVTVEAWSTPLTALVQPVMKSSDNMSMNKADMTGILSLLALPQEQLKGSMIIGVIYILRFAYPPLSSGIEGAQGECRCCYGEHNISPTL